MNKYNNGNLTATFVIFDKISNDLMNYTQDKAYGKRVWHKNFSSVGRTVYWDKMFNHISGMYGDVLSWKE